MVLWRDECALVQRARFVVAMEICAHGMGYVFRDYKFNHGWDDNERTDGRGFHSIYSEKMR